MNLFESARVNSITLKNRIIRSATYEGSCDKGGNPTDFIAGLYKKLADGEVGAIITGYVGVNHQGRTTELMPLFENDSRIDAFKKSLEYPHSKGVPVILQVAHGGGQAHAKPPEMPLLGPSKFRFPLAKESARAMTAAEIEIVINDFVSAIVRAQKTGYDGVQLHCAHGYLLSQFLSPKTNKRKDQWGGSIENRFRIIEEIFKRAKKQVGTFPIWAKISAYSVDKNNITLDESIVTAQLLEKAGCDLIEVSCGTFLDGFSTCRGPKTPVDAFINLSSQRKNASPVLKFIWSLLMPLFVSIPKPIFNYNIEASTKIKAAVTIPVACVGGLREKAVMEKCIEEKKCDFISLSRPLILEPNLVQRFRDKHQERSRCIDCLYCLVGCLENPLRCYYGKIIPVSQGERA